MNEQWIIDVYGLSKQFNGKMAVNELSLQIKQGEIFGFLGSNGSGKTTTIRMLCGLIQPDKGRGTCLGYDVISQAALIKSSLGYVPQTFSLYQDLTVEENLKFIARANNEKNYLNRINEIIGDLNLHPYRNVLAGNLSGGWKQQVSLAAALIHQPRLLLLDEPTSGVDPKTRQAFWSYISYLTTTGITVLVSTHYMDEAEKCNRLAYIVNGELMIQGTLDQMMQQVKLFAFLVEGSNLAHLANELQNKSQVEQVVHWGNSLRVCDSNAFLLKELIDAYPNYQWNAVTANLEEVFIHLVHSKISKGR
ncbi:ABC transporter ATP-binding protein [Legionella longbeachae]|nr:ABC transporter ATP-binding protein [Legionella longbeachae]EEZ95567.1 ABC transporter ATP-binding protein [Legionella longbeachae D-4968]HBD7399348.1 ABC transporter ATP-binding protein [Legionella pneumophila]ARM35017.2 ABC transporter ATP-binding protein [Legionella longbeachae]QEY53197.1 ABC transporter ATP-binding protein [Legionella longbeachae]